MRYVSNYSTTPQDGSNRTSGLYGAKGYLGSYDAQRIWKGNSRIANHCQSVYLENKGVLCTTAEEGRDCKNVEV